MTIDILNQPQDTINGQQGLDDLRTLEARKDEWDDIAAELGTLAVADPETIRPALLTSDVVSPDMVATEF